MKNERNNKRILKKIKQDQSEGKEKRKAKAP